MIFHHFSCEKAEKAAKMMKNEAKIIVFSSFYNACQQKNAGLAPYKTGENIF